MPGAGTAEDGAGPTLYVVPDDITRFAQQPCPYCGKPLDAAGPADRSLLRSLQDGDFLLCIGCAEPAVVVIGPFGLGMRKASEDELAEFAVEHGHHVEKLRRFLAENPEPEAK